MGAACMSAGKGSWRAQQDRQTYCGMGIAQHCRRGDLVRQPFFAKFDPEATWFDTLEPLTDRDKPFFPGSWEELTGEPEGTVPLSIGAE